MTTFTFWLINGNIQIRNKKGLKWQPVLGICWFVFEHIFHRYWVALQGKVDFSWRCWWLIYDVIQDGVYLRHLKSYKGVLKLKENDEGAEKHR